MAAIVLQKKMMIDMYNYGTENPNFRGGVSENWDFLYLWTLVC